MRADPGFGIERVLSLRLTLPAATHQGAGVRVALGASRRDVMAMVFCQAMRVVGPGIGVGIATSIAAAQLVRGQLYGVGTVEPSVMAGVSLAVLVASALAVLVPARRGASVDPMVALRSE
jgi:ABC-type antimicrobial peptide transport system permease subunit